MSSNGNSSGPATDAGARFDREPGAVRVASPPAVTVPDRPPSGIDRGVLGVLVDQIGGPDVDVGGLITTYLTDASERMTVLVAAVGRDDGPAAAQAAHGLRSGSTLFGALCLAQLLQQAETAVRTGVGDLQSLGREIAAEYYQVTSDLQQMRLTP